MTVSWELVLVGALQQHNCTPVCTTDLAHPAGAPAAVNVRVIVTAQGAAEGGAAPVNPLVTDLGAVNHGVAGGAVALTRTAAAAVAPGAVGQIPTAHRTVAVIAAKAGGTAALQAGRGHYVYHRREKHAATRLKGTGRTL